MSEYHDKLLEALKQTNPPNPDAWVDFVKCVERMHFMYNLDVQVNEDDRYEIAIDTFRKIHPRIQGIKEWKYIVVTASRVALLLVKKRKRQSPVPLHEIDDDGSDDPQFNQYAASHASLCLEVFNDDQAKLDDKHLQEEVMASLPLEDRFFLESLWAYENANPGEKKIRAAFAKSIGWTEIYVNVNYHRIIAELKKKFPRF